MRLPRMTIRRWMVVVVVVGLLCLLVHRHRAFTAIASYHESRMVARMFPNYRKYLGREIPRPNITAEFLARSLDGRRAFVYFDRDGKDMTKDEVIAAIWHDAMAAKYRQAARFPWFPVMPDPPIPSKRTDPPETE
jgi:hypothetical protein